MINSILDPSGCGKTTLLRMIAGFMEPTDGLLKIRDKDMAGIGPNRRPVNLVFQNLALFPIMDEFVDLLGFSFEIKAYEKNNRRHIADISRIIFLYNAEIGRKYSKSTGSWM